MKENKFQTELTKEEIREEIDKLGHWLNQVPEHLQSETVIFLIFQATLFGISDLTRGIETIDEAKKRYIEVLTETGW